MNNFQTSEADAPEKKPLLPQSKSEWGLLAGAAAILLFILFSFVSAFSSSPNSSQNSNLSLHQNLEQLALREATTRSNLSKLLVERVKLNAALGSNNARREEAVNLLNEIEQEKERLTRQAVEAITVHEDDISESGE